MNMDLGLVVALVYGLIFGSFASVLIYRSVFERSPTLLGRSYCPHCRHKLAAIDLIPIFSYLYFRGRCHYCHKPISVLYPLLEVATALTFGFSYLWWKTQLGIIVWQTAQLEAQINLIILFLSLILVFLLVCIFFTDALYYVLPDVLTLPAILLVLVFKLLIAYLNWQLINTNLSGSLKLHNSFPLLIKLSLNEIWLNLGLSLLMAVVLAGFFGLIFYFSKGRAIGDGDIRLGFLMGLVLGFPSSLVGFFASFMVGGMIATLLLMTGYKKFGQKLPLGPFLIFGTLVAYFYGFAIWEAYLTYLS